VYSKQFDWTARYPGADNTLGRADFRMNNSDNPLGVLTHEGIARRKDELRAEIVGLAIKYYSHVYDREFLDRIDNKLLKTDTKGADAEMFNKMLANAMDSIDKTSTTNPIKAFEILSAKKEGESFDKIERLQRHLIKLNALAKTITDKDDAKAMDDVVVKELVLVKGQEYEFKLRSMDVIHSAYFPHFRSQMNTVPGQITRLKFVPKYTTKEMRKLMNNEKFEYVLLCNKICGAAHSNMQMKVTVVEKQEEVDAWLKTAGKPMKVVLFGEPVAQTAPADSTANPDSTLVKADSTKASK
jgi:cytochrome c oxidase subunit II